MPFSRPFVHPGLGNPHDELISCPPSGNDICKTSFISTKVEIYLSAFPGADEIKVIEVVQGTQRYFALLARQNGLPMGSPLVGDLPCPNECIPPMILGNTSFDPSHLSDVIGTPNCILLQIHRSRQNGQVVYSDFSIYAITYTVQGGINEEDDPGDAMYTTIN
jgi:hypothetical protein